MARRRGKAWTGATKPFLTMPGYCLDPPAAAIPQLSPRQIPSGPGIPGSNHKMTVAAMQMTREV